MKKRVINFGDNRLFGGLGEWGLVLTAWAGVREKGYTPAHNPLIIITIIRFSQRPLLKPVLAPRLQWAC